MAGPQEGTTIIKKVKKAGHAGAHGGAWKVAYADFVTAMMAFFLLLWLLNVTTDEQKQGVADFFSPASISRATSGAGGVLGGRTIIEDGGKISTFGLPSSVVGPSSEKPEDNPDVESEDPGQNRIIGKLEGEKAGSAEGEKSGGKAETDLFGNISLQDIMPGGRQGKAAADAAQAETEALEQVEQEIKQILSTDPKLAELAKNVMFDQTPDGLRIQIVDQQLVAMFPSGSALMNPQAKKFLEEVAGTVKSLPNKLAVAGHTDAVPFKGANPNYSNWELSADRANASRRVMIAAGIKDDRFRYVAGHADQDPLVKNDPMDGRNRRMSIMVLRDTPQPGSRPADTAALPRGAAPPRPAAAGAGGAGGDGSNRYPPPPPGLSAPRTPRAPPPPQ